MIDRAALASYIEAVLGGPLEVVAPHPLKDASAPAGEDPEGFGYGVPFDPVRLLEMLGGRP